MIPTLLTYRTCGQTLQQGQIEHSEANSKGSNKHALFPETQTKADKLREALRTIACFSFLTTCFPSGDLIVTLPVTLNLLHPFSAPCERLGAPQRGKGGRGRAAGVARDHHPLLLHHGLQGAHDQLRPVRRRGLRQLAILELRQGLLPRRCGG